jgi:hypothetical protein
MLCREEYGNIGAASPNSSLYGTRCDGTRPVSYDSARSGRGRIEGEFYLLCSFKKRGQWDLSSLTPTCSLFCVRCSDTLPDERGTFIHPSEAAHAREPFVVRTPLCNVFAFQPLQSSSSAAHVAGQRQATLSRPLEKTRDNAKPSFFVLDAEFFSRFYSLLGPATGVFSESLNQPEHNQLLSLPVPKQEHAELSSLRF